MRCENSWVVLCVRGWSLWPDNHDSRGIHRVSVWGRTTTSTTTTTATMIAMFVFTVVMGVTTSSFTQFLKNKTIIESQINDIKQFQLGLSILNNDFSQVVLWPRDEQLFNNGGFHSKNNSVTFSRLGVINPNFSLQKSSIETVTYDYRNNGLVRVINDNGKQYRKTILKDINKLQVRYIDENNKQYSLWPPINDWRNKLPAGLSIEFEHPRYGNIKRYFVIQQYNVGVKNDEP